MDIYSSITLSVSIVALGATAPLLIRLVRHAPRASGVGEIVLVLDREFRGPALGRSEDFVLHRLAEDYRGGVSGLSAEARGHVCRVGRFYGDAGMVAAMRGSDAWLPTASAERRPHPSRADPARAGATTGAEASFAEVVPGGARLTDQAHAAAPFRGLLHSRAAAVWAVLRPYVEVERRRRGSTWWQHFENLATHRERTQAAKASTPLTTASKRREWKRSKA